MWNVDLCFFDKEPISNAEFYCDSIIKNTNQAHKTIIKDIKRELIKKGIYSFDQYKSVDVYKAVMENGVKDINEFLTLFN